MKQMSFGLKVFITLFVLCITGVVFSTIAIDKQIDNYIDEIRTEIQIVNNSGDEVIIDREDNKIIISINPIENKSEEVTKMENETYGIVTSMSGLNIRHEASVESNRVGVLEYGAKVKILEDCGDWYRIENGYIFKDYIIKN